MQISLTQQKLLDAGRAEFLEKGYSGSSLRRIVKQAGFTLGAFYGYYHDKAALFEALAEPAAGDFLNLFALSQDAYYMQKTGAPMGSEVIIEYIYKNAEAFKLIISCAEGTKYESYIDRLAEIEVSKSEANGRLDMDKELRHLISCAYFTAIFEPLRRDIPIDKAKEYAAQAAKLFAIGRAGLMAEVKGLLT